MNKYIIKSLSVICGAMMAAGCTTSFDGVNTDPDNPLASQVPSTNILAYCERYASDNMFDEWFDINETCGFSGQIAKWMYTQEGYYNFRPTVNSSSWRVCDYVVSNLKEIIEKEDTTSNMWAAATIFQCQIWQVKSDRWGNIPYWTTTGNKAIYSDALRLADGITAPRYDKQENIYPDLLVRLEKAVTVLEQDEKGDDLGSGEVLLSANNDAWIKYGNALRLRIAARIAEIAPKLAKKTFEDVIADGNIPTTNDDNVFFQWNNEYAEPWADYFQSRNNEYGVSELMINTLQDYLKDPRLSVYAAPTRENGTYVGYPVGSKANASVKKYSQIGNRFQNRSNVTGFSPWLRSCEVYFQLAYAASKGLIDGDANAYYQKAVTLSLEENSIENGAIAAYLASDAVKDASLDNIFLQWWISVYKNGQEAWSVYRMAPTDTYLFKNNKIAVNSYYPDHNCPPMCYGYPDTERNLNTASCAVESAAEVDYFWGKQMWWDVRKGLK